jgi:3-hydroxyisobutyrate dehydrogenase-like beta-hydroxyacid dehydrogenase
MKDSPIGLIGVGLLGTALAERMLSAKLSVIGYDLEPSRLDQLEPLGGERRAYAVEVAAACNCLVLCLPDSQIVKAVIDSLAPAVEPGTLIIDATTGDPDDTVALANSLSEWSVAYLDATVAGSSEQVRQGNATIIVGASADDFARAQYVLTTWSDKQFHVGPPGSGARLKLIVNLVLGLNRAVLAEGLSLAKAFNIDIENALEVLKHTPAYSTVMDTKGLNMIARDYAPQARLAQHLKDVRLIRQLAQRQNSHTPLSDVHEELLLRAIELGFGDADNSAIIEAFQQTSKSLRS